MSVSDEMDARIKIVLQGILVEPSTGLYETGGFWGLQSSSVRINKRFPEFSAGFNWDLAPTSHFYKRWFDYPDLGKRGWMIMFQVHPPDEPGHRPAEYICAWVPPDREKDADQWIDFLNAEIRDRLRTASPGHQP